MYHQTTKKGMPAADLKRPYSPTPTPGHKKHICPGTTTIMK